jgi:hypothetical protein
MTDPLRELLREARDFISVSGVHWQRPQALRDRIDAALAQQPEPVTVDVAATALHKLMAAVRLEQDTEEPFYAALNLLHRPPAQPPDAKPEPAGWMWLEEGVEQYGAPYELRPGSAVPLYAAPQPPAGNGKEPATCPHGIRLPHECRDCQERLGKIELAIIRVCGEMRDEAHERRQSDKEVGMFPDEHTAQLLTEWADRLELTNSHLLEDIYEQCCEAIKPHVDSGRLPASLVESVQKLADAIPREIHERLIHGSIHACNEFDDWAAGRDDDAIPESFANAVNNLRRMASGHERGS